MTDWFAALGLESGHSKLVPYDPRWPALFREAEAEIRAAAGDRILCIEHVGSTSVPGLTAKPVLDILVGVADFAAALDLVPALAPLGYEFRPQEEIPDRHYFRRRVGTLRTHHLSLAEPASKHFRDTIAFRDALRADARLAREYEAVKLALAARFPRDRVAYTDGKTDFVVGVLGGIARRADGPAAGGARGAPLH
jgi:GrpB-like predicted nucleotidyltransferase (UPF0157 family)